MAPDLSVDTSTDDWGSKGIRTRFWKDGMLVALVVLLVSVILATRYVYKRLVVLGRLRAIRKPAGDWMPPARDVVMERLRSEAFDLVIVGGGSTGVGCALDGATRGLKVALVDARDFGSGTSSKSTKLVHGGVRYLAKAVCNLDWSQYKLVWEALDERSTMFGISPYLTNSIKIMVPIYSRILVPYYYIGLKLYDWLSGLKSLGRSYFVGRDEAVDTFPHINKKNLCGAMVYLDGQQDDVRNNVMLATTAAYYGAAVANHLRARSLVIEDGRVVGVLCKDEIGECEVEIRGSGVISSVGNLADEVRRMGGADVPEIMVQSSGTHIVIPSRYGPKNMGFLDPLTSDNRVAFFMPWMGKALVGGTDNRTKAELEPCPTDEDLEFLMHEVQAYTSVRPKLSREDVSAIWTGIRPLVKDPHASETEAIVRKHYIGVERNGLLTVTGGKWTIYRKMAEEAIDLAISTFSLKAGPCVTKHVKILGADGYDEDMWMPVQRELGVARSVAQRLVRFYGARALDVCKYIKRSKKAVLSPEYSYFVGEVEYCIDNEMAIRICDVLCNRLMFGMVDVRGAYGCIEKVLEVFRTKHRWNADRCSREETEAIRMLNMYGLSVLKGKVKDNDLPPECPLEKELKG